MLYIRRGIAVVLAPLLTLGVGMPMVSAAPDAAPANTGLITAVLETTKTVAESELTPGQQTVYTVTAGCTSGNTLCADAVLTDIVPAPLVVEMVQVSGAFAHDATVSQAGEGNREITVSFASQSDDGASGLKDGSTTTILITVRLPQDVSAEYDGTPLVNKVDIVASNATPKSAEATVALKVPITFGADISKRWSTGGFIAGVGGENNVELSNIKNTSNVGATSLTIVEPSGPNNPFNVVGFTGFGNIVFPAGADQVQVNAVMTDGGTAEGVPGTTAVLPDGVTNEQVKGLVFVFTSTKSTPERGGIDANGSAGSISFATTVPADAPSGTVDNEVSITAQTPKGDSAPKTAQAPFTITDARYSVSAAKSFESSTIVEGGTSTVKLSGTNTSDQPLTSMTITEPSTGTVNPFTATPGMTFTGFAEPCVTNIEGSPMK